MAAAAAEGKRTPVPLQSLSLQDLMQVKKQIEEVCEIRCGSI